ncbi:hypothetical protein K474DRAFT_1645008 [Panus rudis PR-1116 ss-1]|nr:hypothetical protein K474DRAFT_1645008 [Panus rudis PR-1116 ss-1]
MPGPRNAKKQKALQARKQKKSKTVHKSPDHVSSNLSQPQATAPMTTLTLRASPADEKPSSPTAAIDGSLLQKSVIIPCNNESSLLEEHRGASDLDDIHVDTLLKRPFIHDPGNGPRVKDIHTFLSSSFAAPPSLDDPLCAEFAQEEMLEMLCSVLPEEIALVLWYNKSRLTARICPTCQRFYRLGDSLPDHIPVDERELRDRYSDGQPMSELLSREQEISGLCSSICFILAAFNYPAAISSTFGRMAEDLTDDTWELLDAKSGNGGVNDMGLGMLLKMTRCHDLGLGQLFFPELELDSEPEEQLDDSEDAWTDVDSEVEEDFVSAESKPKQLVKSQPLLWNTRHPIGR